ncbi:MAG: hypothetical protein U0232_04060 [Thermomicrobiales bacterium]
MDWTSLILRAMLGLMGPFANGRMEAQMPFRRYCLFLGISAVALGLIGVLCDFFFDTAKGELFLMSGAVLGASGLVGYGLARVLPPFGRS